MTLFMAGHIPFSIQWLLCMLGLALIPAQSGGADSLLAPGCTLVILSGVPGDLESETQDRDQLRSCLDIARGETNVARAIILCDNPDSLGLPASVASPRPKVIEFTFWR